MVDITGLTNMTPLPDEVWAGPTPPGSFSATTDSTIQMSTPEYMFLRKANQLDGDEAIDVCCELLSRFCTRLTHPSFAVDKCVPREEPHTTERKVKRYLSQIMDTEEGERALQVLNAARKRVVAHERECMSKLGWE